MGGGLGDNVLKLASRLNYIFLSQFFSLLINRFINLSLAEFFYTLMPIFISAFSDANIIALITKHLYA